MGKNFVSHIKAFVGKPPSNFRGGLLHIPGQPAKGLIRSTYLIGENGVIEKAFGAVKAKDNPAQMLKEL